MAQNMSPLEVQFYVLHFQISCKIVKSHQNLKKYKKNIGIVNREIEDCAKIILISLVLQLKLVFCRINVYLYCKHNIL